MKNGSTIAVSRLSLGLVEYDNNAIYRCSAKSTIMATQEEPKYTQLTLAVQCK